MYELSRWKDSGTPVRIRLTLGSFRPRTHMPRPTARIALLLGLLACLPASTLARADSGPSGQFQPSATDRDGDGLPDASDCAPDDPSRPARAGDDQDCDGTPDAGGGSRVGLAGPVDGGPDPQQTASRPSRGSAATKTRARRAAGEAVVAVRGLRLGDSIAVYAPRRPHRATPTVVFVAKDNSAVTVRPTLVLADGRKRALKARSRSLPSGRAYVVRLHLSHAQRRAARLRLAMTVIDASGNRHRATRVVRVAG